MLFILRPAENIRLKSLWVRVNVDVKMLKNWTLKC